MILTDVKKKYVARYACSHEEVSNILQYFYSFLHIMAIFTIFHTSTAAIINMAKTLEKLRSNYAILEIYLGCSIALVFLQN